MEVSDALKVPIEHFDDHGIDWVKEICEKWGQNWIKDFPHINLKPKAHNLIFVLPEVLKRTRSYNMFYKMEERGESIYAELNRIQCRIWGVWNQEEQMWKYIEQYELKNHLDISIVEPEKRLLRK